MPNNEFYRGPLPSLNFGQQASLESFPPMVGFISGEVALSRLDLPLGVALRPGKVIAVYMSVASQGKKDSAVYPSGEFEVYINGVSCLSTKPRISHISGEAAGQKTTFPSAEDTGVISAVVNPAANDVAIGDIFTMDFLYYGETSPTTKMKHPSVVVVVDPS